MKVDISGIYLVDYKKNENAKIRKLYLDNDELSKFSRRIRMPKSEKIARFDSINDSIFSTYPRFKIEELDIH